MAAEAAAKAAYAVAHPDGETVVLPEMRKGEDVLKTVNDPIVRKTAEELAAEAAAKAAYAAAHPDGESVVVNPLSKLSEKPAVQTAAQLNISDDPNEVQDWSQGRMKYVPEQTPSPVIIPESPKALELTPITPPVTDSSIPKASDDHGNIMTVTTTVTETKTETVTDPTPVAVVHPADTTVITDPTSGTQLSITINDRGIATVKWRGQEYKGFFDARTNSVILVTSDDSIWTLQFAVKAEGGFYLQSFHSSSGNLWNSSEETFTYNPQGQLIRKDWLNENPGSGCTGDKCWISLFGSSRSGGTIDYVQINGKTLVTHEKSWSENDGIIYYETNLTGSDISQEQSVSIPRYPGSYGRSDSESWYSYDNQGNLMARSWTNNNSWSNSNGLETYVQINGKTLLSSSKVWQYGSPIKWYDPILVGTLETVKDPALKIPSDSTIAYPIEIGVSRLFLYVSSHSETLRHD